MDDGWTVPAGWGRDSSCSLRHSFAERKGWWGVTPEERAAVLLFESATAIAIALIHKDFMDPGNKVSIDEAVDGVAGISVKLAARIAEISFGNG